MAEEGAITAKQLAEYEKTLAEDGGNDELRSAVKALKDDQAVIAAREAEIADLRAAYSAIPSTAYARGGNPEYVDQIGKYIIPKQNTLVEHYLLVVNEKLKLDFYPEECPFDKAVAQAYPRAEFANPAHPDYDLPKYEAARDNVATVRNYLIQAALNGIDTNDEKQLKIAVDKLQIMGKALGKALSKGKIPDAGEPGKGAVEMYALLMDKTRPHAFTWLFRLFGKDYSHWNLPPIEISPFNQANLAVFERGGYAMASAEHIDALPQDRSLVLPNNQLDFPETAPAPPLANHAHHLALLGMVVAGSALSLMRVDALPKPVKKEAVDLARDILDKMRINVADTTTDQWRMQPPDQAVVDSEALSQIAQTYANAYQNTLHINPHAKEDPLLQESNEALGKLGFLIKNQAMDALLEEGKFDEAKAIKEQIDQLPPEWKNITNMPIENLLAQVQSGLERTQLLMQQVHEQNVANAAARQLPESVANLPPEVIRALAQKGISQAEVGDLVRRSQVETGATLPVPGYQRIVEQGGKTPVSSAPPQAKLPIDYAPPSSTEKDMLTTRQR